MKPLFMADHKISDHFSLSEVINSSTAKARGIDNSLITPEQYYRAKRLALKVLDPIRKHYNKGYSPESWFRCEELEKVIARKGYENWCEKHGYGITEASWGLYFARKTHPLGGTADIEVPGVSNLDLFNYIKYNLEYDQLILEFHKKDDPRSGWVHVSWNDENKRMQAFSIG